MTRVVISPSAMADAHDVWLYIARDNAAAAGRWADSLDDVYQTLSQHPRLGPARHDLGKNIRYFPMGSYLVIYRELPDGVEIIRILHGARNLEAIFHGDE